MTGAGSVAVEAALVLPAVMLPLLFSVAAMGHSVSTQVRLDRALHTAMLYAWATPGAAVSGIQSAATSGYGAGAPTMATPVSTIACYCIQPTGTRQSGTAIACTGTCTTGLVRASYVTTSLTATVTTTLPVASSLMSQTLTAAGTVRLQ